MFYTEIVKSLCAETNEVILFHSATGKDSIMLLDLLSKSFDKVQCVFMYVVPELEFENKYIAWAEKKYKNCSFIKTPHYATYSFIKSGYLGIAKDPNIKQMSISQISKRVSKQTKIDWSVYGFKKIDSLARRIMLNTYENGIYYPTKKAYPLSDLKTKEVYNYISDNNLIPPFNYNNNRTTHSGCDIYMPEFLDYMRNKYPNDLKRIFAQFPETEVILFKYDNYGKN
jgi:sulfate adenylyltransferase subunit 2